MNNCIVLSNEFDENSLFKEYNMTNTQVKKDVAIIRKWMLTQQNLPELPESKNGL